MSCCFPSLDNSEVVMILPTMSAVRSSLDASDEGSAKEGLRGLAVKYVRITSKVWGPAEIAEELHKVRWDLRVKREEIHSLQKALSEANVQLYDERATVLKLTAENEELRKRPTTINYNNNFTNK